LGKVGLSDCSITYSRFRGAPRVFAGENAKVVLAVVAWWLTRAAMRPASAGDWPAGRTSTAALRRAKVWRDTAENSDAPPPGTMFTGVSTTSLRYICHWTRLACARWKTSEPQWRKTEGSAVEAGNISASATRLLAPPWLPARPPPRRMPTAPRTRISEIRPE